MHTIARSDKWYLGGGDRLLWSPPFPVWLRHPGLWDEVHYFNRALFPCFTWTLLDARGRPWPLQRSRLAWSPAGLSALLEPSGLSLHGSPVDDGFTGGGRGEVTAWEALAVTEEDLLCAEVTVEGDDAAWEGGLWLVVWTAQPDTGGLYVLPDGQETSARDFAAGEWGVLWTRTIMPANHPRLELRCRLSLDRPADSWAVQFSEGRPAQPHWGLTPWSGPWEKPGLPGDVRQSGNAPHGLYYAGLAVELEGVGDGRDTVLAAFDVLGETGETAVASERVEAGAETVRDHPAWVELIQAERESVASAEPDVEGPVPFGGSVPGVLLRHSARSWDRSLADSPVLESSDPCLAAAFRHRCYALRLLEGRGGHGRQEQPHVCEGIGYFRIPIAYSAHAHMRDLRWRRSPTAAQGSLLNFIANQLPDGSFPGRIYHNTDRKSDFYLADWGAAALAVDAVHPDPVWIERIYEPLGRYAAFFDTERDREQSGLYDIVSHYETGQEYMSRYMAVHSEADTVGWVPNIRLKAIDATVYVYRLKRALARFARRLGREAEADDWDRGADRIAVAVRERMWDEDEKWFSDVDPRTMEPTGVKAAVGFYPFMTDIAGVEHTVAIWEHLLDPDQFWTPFPVPATSADDPWFDPDARWKGKRMNCPWNGRVWPMTNSHVFDALLRAARTLDAGLAPHAAHFLKRFVTMLFTDGDPERPNTFEHYHPYTGRPCFYRGIDDYLHSWLLDPILQGAVGLHPPELEGADVEAAAESGLELDPLPTGIERLHCRGIPWRGHLLDVQLEGSRARVAVDGAVVAEGDRSAGLVIPVQT